MKRFLLAYALGALGLFAPVAAHAGPAADLISAGDGHDRKFEAPAALEFYLPAEKLEPDNVALLLKIARQYRHEMADASSSAEKLRFAKLGTAYAERAISLNPKQGEAHLSLAISHAKSLGLLGNKEKMATLRVIKASVDRAIALDPNQDLAWYILGCWNQRVTELGGLKRSIAELAYGGLPAADDATAVRCFEKAIALNPSRCVYYVELGRTHAHLGNDDVARKFIQKGMTMPNTGKDDAETKQKGRQTLAGL